MIATKEQQKKKAVELLQKLGVHELFTFCAANCENFVKDYFSVDFNAPKLKELIEIFEKTTGSYVYYVLYNDCTYGECYSFLVVSQYEEDIQRTDIRESKDGSLAVMAWVENVTFPERSEYGTILVREKNGFLSRVY